MTKAGVEFNLFRSYDAYMRKRNVRYEHSAYD